MPIVNETSQHDDQSLTGATKVSKVQRGPPPLVRSAEHRFARRDGLVLEHLKMAKAIAVRMHLNLPATVDLDDLVQAGVIGLFDAADKFDADRQDDFSHYAKHRIKGAILDSLRRLDWASRDMRRNHKRAEEAKRDLTMTLQRSPTEVELAEKLGVDIARYRTIALDLENMAPISADSRGNQSEDLPPPDFPGKPETQPDFIYVQREMRGILGKAIKTLSERYQKVVTLYYTKELTLKEIGRVLGVNESRVSQMHTSALEQMAAILHQGGIDSIHAFQG